MRSLFIVGPLALFVFIAGCKKPASLQQAQEPPAPPGSKVVSFNVPGMECDGCAAHVHDALAGLEGVYSCKADFETKTATCTIDPAKFKPDLALKKLEEEKYPATLKN